jgi:3-hydroxyacyl-CoA dehydrogenase, NAD binding domain
VFQHVSAADYVDACQICEPEAILSSNTSSISITRLAAATSRPERVVCAATRYVPWSTLRCAQTNLMRMSTG